MPLRLLALLSFVSTLVACGGGGGGGDTAVVEPEAENPIPALIRTSPGAAEVGVGVERPISLDFSVSLDEETVTSDAVRASVGGAVISNDPIVEGDGERVHLFFTSSPMPLGTTVRVTVDGDLLMSRQGDFIDADGDGEPGGIGIWEFTTQALRQVNGTEIAGRVVAAEDADKPLQGVVVSIDGLHDAVAVTDVDGNFLISDAPAGPYYIEIDGGSAENAADDFEHATIKRLAESRPGVLNNLGTIHLPAIADDGFRFAANGPHVIPPEQLLIWPEADFVDALERVEMDIPAGTPFVESDGSGGGKFAVAAVPAGRPPGFMPPELDLPIIGVIQTNGRHRFQHLVGATLPNLAPPSGASAPAAGATVGLWHYDSDVGRFNLVGPMTVSADGLTVTTNEEVGLPGPGLFGASPAVQMTLFGDGVADVRCANTVPGSGNDVGWNLLDAASACSLEVPALDVFQALAAARAALIELDADLDEMDTALEDGECGPAGEAADALRTAPQELSDAWTTFAEAERFQLARNALRCSAVTGIEINAALCEEALCMGAGATTLCDAAEALATVEQALQRAALEHDPAAVDTALSALLAEASSAAGALDRCSGSAANAATVTSMQALVGTLLDALEAGGGAAAAVVDAEAGWTQLVDESLAAALVGSGGFTRLPWRLTIGEEERRGRTDGTGSLSLILPPESEFVLELYVHPRRTVARTSGTTPAAGERGVFGPFVFEPVDPSLDDNDGDGIPNSIEQLIGSNVGPDAEVSPSESAAARDTDGDGRQDGAELYFGHDPLVPFTFDGAILTSAETATPAVDVAVRDHLVAVAQGEGGVRFLSVADRFVPLRLADIDTPGQARRVALAGGFAAVADGGEGLAIIDVRRPTRPEVTHQLNLGAPVNAVAADAGLAFAGLENNAVVSVDVHTGGVLGQIFLDGPVLDLSVSNGHLYALTNLRVHAIEIRLGLLLAGGSHASPADIVNLRIFAGQDTLFVVHAEGTNTFNVEDPLQPLLKGHFNGDPPSVGWRQLIPNGSGQALGVVGANPGNTQVRSYTLFGSAQEPLWDETVFPTPGNPRALRVEGGLAFVADSEAGLQVMAPLGFDTGSVPPSVTLVTEPAAGVIEEGQVVRALAVVSDDKEVAAVEFLLNDRPFLRDGTYPFEVTLVAPQQEEERDFRLRARAIDTGGLIAESGSANFDLQPDQSAPVVLSALPEDGSQLAIGAEVTLVAVLFNEPMDLATLLDGGVDVMSSGPDFRIGTADDIVVTPPSVFANGTFQSLFFVFAEKLPADHYRIRVANTVSDLSGNRVAAEVSTTFSVLGVDTDGDGLFDDFETNVLGTNPLKADHDGDGLLDGEELLVYGTDPFDQDGDADGILDGVEVAFGTDPTVANASTTVHGSVRFATDIQVPGVTAGAPTPNASVHIEDAELVGGNKVVSFTSTSNQNGVFSFGCDGAPNCQTSKWPTGPHQVRIEVRFELPSTGQVFYGFSDFFAPVAGGQTDVGFIDIYPVEGSRGLDFIGALLTNSGGLAADLEVWVTAEEPTTARITAGGSTTVHSINVPQGGVGQLRRDLGDVELDLLANGTADGVVDQAVHVLFDGPAANVQLRSSAVGGVFPDSTDVATALPRHSLGIRHRVSSYSVDPVTQIVSQLAVVGSVNDTTVTITPSTSTELRVIDEPFTIELDRLEVYHLATKVGDLTGTLVESNKPVAVFSGHQCAAVEDDGVPDCDLLYEQVPPRRTTWDTVWGQDYYAVPLATRAGGDVYSIVTDDKPAKVTIGHLADPDNDPFAVLQLPPNASQKIVLDGFFQIHASNPIQVTQISTSSTLASSPEGLGGPFSMVLSDRSRHLTEYTFFVPDDAAFERHFVNVLIRGDQATTLELDGLPLPGTQAFEPIVGSNTLVGAQVEVAPGAHVLRAGSVFGLSVYGFGAQQSYGYPAGL